MLYVKAIGPREKVWPFSVDFFFFLLAFIVALFHFHVHSGIPGTYLPRVRARRQTEDAI